VTKFERLLITKTPLAFVLNRTKHLVLPGFEGVPLYDVLRFFYRQIKTHGLTERASAISYNFIMAVPPSLLFLFTLIPNLPWVSKKSIQHQLHSIIVDVVPSKVYNKELLKFTDSFLYDHKIGLLSFGLLFSLFFASNGMMGVIRSFNRKYIGFEKRMGLHKRWTAIKLTMLIFALVLGYLILLILQGALLKQLVSNSWLRDLITYTRWVGIVALVFYAFGFIFRYAPAVEKKWKFNNPGTIIATMLSILSSIGFSLFVNNFGRYNVLYGSIGTIMVVIALIYINSLAILIGFELNVSINSLKISAHLRQEEENRQEELQQRQG
jgi:membrane protein